MTHEYFTMQVIALLGLAIFSILLGIRNRHLGFGTLGLAGMLERFDVRRQTPLGRRVRKPSIVRHARDAFRQALWGSAPSIITLGALAALASTDPGLLLVPIIAIPYGLALFALFWWIQKESVPAYQAEYDEYLRLTDPGNLWFEGRIFAAEPLLLQKGRVIQATHRPLSGPPVTLRLFVPFVVDQRYRMPSGSEVVRVIYTPILAIDDEPLLVDGAAVDAELIGLQFHPTVIRPPIMSDYEMRRGEREARVGVAR
ncbi:MAG: hypothetical protein ACEQSB_03810 [Undibacterium sp.]